MLQIKFIYEQKLNLQMQNEGGTLQNVSIVRQYNGRPWIDVGK